MVLSFSLLSNEKKKHCSIQVRPIHDQISPSNSDAVRYVHLSKAPEQYSMGIFVFPPHAKIPLHDHPGMCVLSRVIYGDLRRLSLDLPRRRRCSNHRPRRRHHNNSSSRSWLPCRTRDATDADAAVGAGAPQQRRLAYKNRADRLQAPDCAVLYPYEGNLHEFVAGPNGAAMLDGLLPPYDVENDRDCTFYHIQQDLSRDEEKQQLLLLEEENGDEEGGDVAFGTSGGSSSSSNSENHQRGTPCWIVPTGQPEDFHCISGTYRDLGEVSS